MDKTHVKIKDLYRFESTIGRGTFATVKRARNRETNEKVAVKILYKKKMEEEDILSFRTEIEILKSVDHPNIVRIIDDFEDSKHYYLVMDLMAGGELFDLIMENGSISELEAREAIRAIIDAI